MLKKFGEDFIKMEEGNVIIPVIISVFAILTTLMMVGAYKVSQIRETGKNY